MKIRAVSTFSDWTELGGSWGRPGVYAIFDYLRVAGIKDVYWRVFNGGPAMYPSKVAQVQDRRGYGDTMKRHAFHQLHYHFAWSVKERQPSISAALKPDLLPEHAPADSIRKVMGSSSYHVNNHLSGNRRLEWQEGYGVVTLRKGEMKKAIAYVEDQERLHQERKATAVFETFEVLVG